ncbi:hypothetical protein D7Z54_33310 [Salibacterium salarium]|uniref:DUF2178 domain-containing protein n=2 Tax=Salibacterium salarium TaxID=284579 RepID=A0A428MSC9_9BACI|nr:hypothetical protein D7Z54_33310 [Salibacterium salarium]
MNGMNQKTKLILGWIIGLAIIAVISFACVKVYQGEELNLFHFFAIGLLIGGFFNLITWGGSNFYAPDSDEANDEMGKHIQKVSSDNSYFIIMVITVLFAYTSSETSWLSYEIALYLVTSLFFIVNPVVQLFTIKKYR